MIEIPTELEDMNLGQLLALSYYIDVSQRLQEAKKPSVKLADNMIKVIAQYVGVSQKTAFFFSRENVKQIETIVLNSLEGIAKEVSTIINTKQPNPFYFDCQQMTADEQTELEIEGKEPKNRKARYYIQDIDKLPSGYWLTMLDGSIETIKTNEEKTPYRSWREIPKILASIAWREQTKKIIKENGSYTINMPAAKRKAELFQYLDATTALKAYAFFLSIKLPSLKQTRTTQFLNQLLLTNTNQARGEKSLAQSGAGRGT